MDTFLVTEDDGPTVVVTVEGAGELLTSGSEITVSQTEPGTSFVAVDSPSGGTLVVTENQESVTDATSIVVEVSEGGVTGPKGSVDVHWDTVPPAPDAPGPVNGLWAVL